MKINPKAKIEKCCSRDFSRPNLCDPYLDCSDPKDIRLVATNGHMMCAIKVEVDNGEEETLSTGYIPLDAIKAARKAKAHMVVEAEHVVVSGVRYPRPTHTFPSWRQVLPRTEPEAQPYLSFNAHYLSDLIEACGGENQAVLRATDALSPIRVEVFGEPDVIAVLMPMRY